MKKNQSTSNKFIEIYKVPVTIGLSIIAVGLVILHTPNLISIVLDNFAQATDVQPEKFTELYFENHLSLPDRIIYGQENQFKFTIHNLENKDSRYPYEVYIDVNGEKQIIDEGMIFVKSGDSKTVDEDFVISYISPRIKILVNLIEKNQKISFWME